MSLPRIVDRMHTVANANFATLMAALITAEGAPAVGLVSTVTLYKRKSAPLWAAQAHEGETLPGLGLYLVSAQTHAKRGGGWREWHARAAWDYFATGPTDPADPEKIMLQGELAAVAILQLIDRMAEDQSTGVISAGDPDQSVSVQIQPSGIAAITVPSVRVLVLGPVIQEDRNQ